MNIKKIIGSFSSFLLIIQVSVLGSLLPMERVFAATENITKLSFVSDEQTIFVDQISDIIKVQVQNADGVQEKLDTSNGKVRFYSDSATGFFAEGPSCDKWSQSVSLTMRKDSYHRNVCYKDSVAGKYKIFAEMDNYPVGSIEPWEMAEQYITVLSGSDDEDPSDPEDPTDPSDDDNDPINFDSIIDVVYYSEALRTGDLFELLADVKDDNGIDTIVTTFSKYDEDEVLGYMLSNFIPGDITIYLYTGSYTIPYSVYWTDGVYEAKTTVKDKLGNETSSTLYFVVDNSDPELSMWIEQVPGMKKAILEFEANDQLSGIAGVSLLVYSEDGQDLLFAADYDYEEFEEYLIEIDFEEYGYYHIVFVAWDHAGNYAEAHDTIHIAQHKPMTIQGLEKYEKEDSVLFTWTHLGDGFKVVVYRSDSEEPIAEIENANSYEDKNLEAGKSYNYKFYVSDAYGNLSDPYIVLASLKVVQQPEDSTVVPSQPVEGVGTDNTTQNNPIDVDGSNEDDKKDSKDVLGRDDEKGISGGSTEAKKESSRLATLLIILMLGLAVYFSSVENRKRVFSKANAFLLPILAKFKKEKKKIKNKK
jgi:hypothetical protein